ncbi:MAG: hypothetical protein EOL89_08150 [Actinobacteria bacterium]|nr:hypothetical protein [Actinomycetota bacterium]
MADSRSTSAESGAATGLISSVLIVIAALFAVATLVLAAAGDRITVATPSTTARLAIVLGYLGLYGALVAVHRRSREGAAAHSSLVAGTVGVVAVIALGTGAYWHCAGDELPVVTQVLWIGKLVTGEAAAPFGEVAGCPVTPPVSLSIARLLALGIVSLGAVKLVTSFSQPIVQRGRVRRASNLILVTGTGDDALPYAAAVARASEPGTLTALVVEHSAENTTTAHGTVVQLADQPGSPSFLPSLVRRKGATALRALHHIDPDTESNLNAFELVRAAVGRPTAGATIRATVRIEDPWAAEEWRRGALANDGWVVDAISSHEATAYELLAQIQSGDHDIVVVQGSGALALAFCAAAAQLGRELSCVRSTLPDEPAAVERLPRIVLFGPGAGTLAENHAVHQRRFANPVGELAVVEAPLTRVGVEEAVGDARNPALIFMEDAGTLPLDLAVRHPWTILVHDRGATGVSSRALVGNARTFGLALRHGEGAVVDSWERMARRGHEIYLCRYGTGTSPAARQWEELSAFYRGSNVRQVVTLVGTAPQVGLSWKAGGGAPAGAGAVTADQLARLAEAEHESWRAYYLQHGWRYGPTRDDTRRMHPSLKPWQDLSEADRRKTGDGVRDSLTMLENFGYLPHQTGEFPWVRYARQGEVTAVQLEAATSWTTSDGQVLTARAGDWMLTAPDGRRWSITEAKLRESYGPREGNRWGRTGHVEARPAFLAESLTTLEGRYVAQPGDWVVRDEDGATWAVPADHFEENYRPA